MVELEHYNLIFCWDVADELHNGNAPEVPKNYRHPFPWEEKLNLTACYHLL